MFHRRTPSICHAVTPESILAAADSKDCAVKSNQGLRLQGLAGGLSVWPCSIPQGHYSSNTRKQVDPGRSPPHEGGCAAAASGAFSVSGNNSAPTVGNDIGTAAPSSKGTGVVSTGALSSINVTRSISLSSTLDAHFADGSFEQAISLHRGVLQFGEMTTTWALKLRHA